MDDFREQVWPLQQQVQRKVRNKEKVGEDSYFSTDEDNHCNTRTRNRHIRWYRQFSMPD